MHLTILYYIFENGLKNRSSKFSAQEGNFVTVYDDTFIIHSAMYAGSESLCCTLEEKKQPAPYPDNIVSEIIAKIKI